MPLYLVAGGYIIPTDTTYDSLQDTKEDYPWCRWDVWAEKGCLYAKVKKPEKYRKEMRSAGEGRCFY